MATNELRKRGIQSVPEPSPDYSAGTSGKAQHPHPAGKIKHGGPMQLLRMLLFATWFIGSCSVLGVTQLLGAPLYFYNKDWYYAYMALTKQSFGILVTTVTQWFSPTPVRVSGDASVRGQLKLTDDGRLITAFPERMVMISNHQIYTDWLYLWWIAYTSRMHGHIFIILKEQLKYIPVLGTGMMFFGFIFMSRKWTSDKPRIKHRLEQLKVQHGGPMSGSAGLDPMWLLIFPEGTNLSPNTRSISAKWAEKQGISDMRNLLLPRSTGLFFCLQELKGTINWVYDCTVGYEGTPKGDYAQNYFTLRSTYFQGRPPKSVNMYWRRFAVSSIPLDDIKDFEKWMSDRWNEKDELMQCFLDTGRFPPNEIVTSTDGTKGAGYLETEVKLERWYEIGQIFVTLGAFAMVADVLAKIWNILLWPFRGSK